MTKNIIICFLIFFLIGCKSKQKTTGSKNEEKIEATIKVLSEEEINAEQKKKAYVLGKRVLMTCNTSKFKPFSEEEATETVRKNTTVEKLTATCQKFRLKYGDFKDILLSEVLYNPKDKTTIYRYKADYQRKFVVKELRVTMNAENKVSSIKSTDWVDEFNL